MAPVLSEQQIEQGLTLVCKALKCPPADMPDFNIQYRKLALYVESTQDEQDPQRLTYDEIKEIIRASTCQPKPAREGSNKRLRWDDSNTFIQENELRPQAIPQVIANGKNQKVDVPQKENSKAEAPAAPKVVGNTKSQPTGPKNIVPKQKEENSFRPSNTETSKNWDQAEAESNQYWQEFPAEQMQKQQQQTCWQPMPEQMGFNCFQPAPPQPVTFQAVTPSFSSTATCAPQGMPLQQQYVFAQVPPPVCPFVVSAPAPQGMQCQQLGHLPQVVTPVQGSVVNSRQVQAEQNPWDWLLEEEEYVPSSSQAARDLEEELREAQAMRMQSCGMVLRNGFWDQVEGKPVLARANSA